MAKHGLTGANSKGLLALSHQSCPAGAVPSPNISPEFSLTHAVHRRLFLLLTGMNSRLSRNLRWHCPAESDESTKKFKCCRQIVHRAFHSCAAPAPPWDQS
eukprot:scaffold63181_cov20-Tisochrysis_lutea.AAC.2